MHFIRFQMLKRVLVVVEHFHLRRLELVGEWSNHHLLSKWMVCPLDQFVIVVEAFPFLHPSSFPPRGQGYKSFLQAGLPPRTEKL